MTVKHILFGLTATAITLLQTPKAQAQEAAILPDTVVTLKDQKTKLMVRGWMRSLLYPIANIAQLENGSVQIQYGTPAKGGYITAKKSDDGIVDRQALLELMYKEGKAETIIEYEDGQPKNLIVKSQEFLPGNDRLFNTSKTVQKTIQKLLGHN